MIEYRNREDQPASNKENQSKINQHNFEVTKTELQDLERKKKVIFSLFPELNSSKEAIKNHSSLVRSDENNALFHKLQLKDEEISKYQKKSENFEKIIISLEEKSI